MALLRSVGEQGAVKRWRKFFDGYEETFDRLKAMGVDPDPAAKVVSISAAVFGRNEDGAALMAKMVGRNGQQVAEEHLQTLVSVLASYGGKPLPRYHGELNRSAIAERCGFDRKVFQTTHGAPNSLHRSIRTTAAFISTR